MKVLKKVYVNNLGIHDLLSLPCEIVRLIKI